MDENGNFVRDGNVTVVLPDGSNVTVGVVNGSASVNWTVPEDFRAGRKQYTFKLLLPLLILILPIVTMAVSKKSSLPVHWHTAPLTPLTA